MWVWHIWHKHHRYSIGPIKTIWEEFDEWTVSIRERQAGTNQKIIQHSKWIIILMCKSKMKKSAFRKKNIHSWDTSLVFLFCTLTLEAQWFCMRGHFSCIVINKDLHWHLRQTWLWGSSALYREIGGILQYYQSCNFLQYHFAFVLFSSLFPPLLFWPFLPCWSVIKSPDPVTSRF